MRQSGLSVAKKLRNPNFSIDTLKKWVKTDLEMLQIQPGDWIADIGTYNGFYPILYSLFPDSVIFDLNDIISDGFVYFDSLKTEAERIKRSKISNSLSFHLGTEFSTNLPTNSYDKIILRDVLHHVTHLDSLLQDIQRIAKPRAKLLLYEPIRIPGKPNKTICSVSMTEEKILEIFHNFGYQLDKKIEVENDRFWFSFSLK